MAYEKKPGQGTLWKNDSASERAPKFSGWCKDPAGKEWRIAAWVSDKPDKNGNKWLSLKLEEPREQQNVNHHDETPADDDDDLF